MSEEVDYWTATIEAFAPLQLSSPELSPKLLKRPPFRFIHNIISSINARFAAYDSVIPVEYLDPADVDTKPKKLDYLERILTYVEKLLGTKIDVNPKKIVAGSEPEKTNVFLQCIALAVGLAQQNKSKDSGAHDAHPAEKARKKRSKSPQESLPSQSPPPASGVNNDNRSVAQSVSVSQPFGNNGSESLPSRDSLPRKKSSSASLSARKAANQAAMARAEAFNKKVDGFSLNLGTSGGPNNVKEDNQSIVRMWQELQTSKTETTPATMPAEALETAIKRQLEAIKQVKALLHDNDKVIEDLESLLI